MYELIKAGEHSYYVQCPSKIGIVKISEQDVILIDSGNDKDAGKKVKRILDSNGWRLNAIYNTHSHADHIGGNRYLSQQTGCKIYAPAKECEFIKNTIFEPSFLYGGYPSDRLRHKFLMAEGSFAEELDGNSCFGELEPIDLPGHSFSMVGFRTSDDVVYLADALSSKETIDKYKIGFIYDIGAYLTTLEAVKNMKARLFIPSHAEPSESIAELAQYNIDAVNSVVESILTVCRRPHSLEELLKRLFDDYSLTMSFEQYALVGSTVRSYLSYLLERGMLEIDFSANLPVVKTIS